MTTDFKNWLLGVIILFGATFILYSISNFILPGNHGRGLLETWGIMSFILVVHGGVTEYRKG